MASEICKNSLMKKTMGLLIYYYYFSSPSSINKSNIPDKRNVIGWERQNFSGKLDFPPLIIKREFKITVKFDSSYNLSNSHFD